MRLGWDSTQITAPQFAREFEQAGVAAVAIHGRTRAQGFSGQVDRDGIRRVVEAVERIPVIGNGDIRTPEDAAAMVAQTGCDAVMIGRTAASNPWIFRQISQYEARSGYEQPAEADRYRMIRTYFRMLIAEQMPGAAGKMKQFASWFTHGVTNGSHLRKAIYEARTEQEILERVEEFFAPVAISASGLAV